MGLESGGSELGEVGLTVLTTDRGVWYLLILRRSNGKTWN